MTNKGLHIRNDEEGLYIFNSHSGLIYYIVEREKEKVLNWLQTDDSHNIEDFYLTTLGAGWLLPLTESNLSYSQILPSINDWDNQLPEFPLTINWFLTGSCPLDCIYCYAEDLMRKNTLNPSLNEIVKIGKCIIDLKPLVVVLTGGDPMVSPYLTNAIELLKGKAGILVDTSGYILREEIADFCKTNNVGIRISLDSSFPEINNFQRPLFNKKHQRNRNLIDNETASIKMCLEKQIPLTIQTVLTDYNYKVLLQLGDFLFNQGVKVWRIQKLQEPSDEIKKESYASLNNSKENYIYEDLIRIIRQRNRTQWNNSISIKFTQNSKDNRNSVILVSPDGRFFTEKINNQGKILIDSKSPYNPSQKSILKFINHSAHLLRYLNVEI